MIDIKELRNNLAKTAAKLSKRGYRLNTDQFTQLEDRRKLFQTQLEEYQATRNQISKQIGMYKQQESQALPNLIEKASTIGAQVDTLRTSLQTVKDELQNFVDQIPNLPHDSVPTGTDENDNEVVRTVGKPPDFHFTPVDHTELGEGLKMLDFEVATKLTGSRFVVLYQDIARLHRALIQMMLDLHTQEHGYMETMVPYIVNAQSLYGTGQLPKFKEDIYELLNMPGCYLIPTAEVPLTCISSQRIVKIEELPLRFVAHTPCFRSEAGSYGRDTRGLIRQHQFEKVELVHVVAPEQSYDALEELTSHAETVLKRLNLAYRTVSLCTGDMGFSATKTYDLEVWIPSQKAYREISSCSNTEAFQARRMQARFRRGAQSTPELVHTLNGSGVAIGRAMLAVMENYQNEDGSITIPNVLQAYMNGQKKIDLQRIS